MPYEKTDWINENVGNKALAPNWGGALFVPACIEGNLEDVKVGKEITFASEDGGILKTSIGLENFVRTEIGWTPAVIFDNHNHALYFWYEARNGGFIQDGATLVHIDEHSDLWGNEYDMLKPDSFDLNKVHDFVRNQTNVGNYIQPAIREWLIGEMIRIEGEGDLLRAKDRIVGKNSILNLDLDIFSPDLDDVPLDLKYEVIRKFAKEASFITIATSPFFIDQELAIGHLKGLFG